MRDEPVLEGFLSPDIQLLGFRGFKRVCQTCCDQEECEEIIAAELGEGIRCVALFPGNSLINRPLYFPFRTFNPRPSYPG